MASTSTSLQSQQATLVAQVKTLINKDLQQICRGENLAVSGVKAQLQARIISHIEMLIRSGDSQRVDILRHRVYNHGVPPQSLSAQSNPFATNGPTSSSSHLPISFGMGSQAGAMAPTYGRPGQKYPTQLRFRDSPFFEIQEPLAKTVDLPGNPSNQISKNTINTSITLSTDVVDKMRSDSTWRVLLYCAAETLPHGHFNQSDINFPQQLEIKVNHNEVKANFKGLKNKAGSTLPADITGFIRKQAAYGNIISITYALTSKKYYMVPMLVKKHSVEELAERIRTRSVIRKQKVITEMVTKASDPDIVATSTNMSLKDPVSYMRISIPVRSTLCAHNQCFDAACFLQLQEQAPTWTCPICNKGVPYESLSVDEYVQEILQNTQRSIDTVTIEPSGRWSLNDGKNGKSNGAKHSPDEDDSDDLVEIVETARPSIKAEAPNTPYSLNMTPPVPSPGSAASASIASRGTKRKSEVIDLTLSDDDEPVAKRPALTPVERVRNGYPSLSRNPSFTQVTNGNVSFQQQQQQPLVGRSPYGGSNNSHPSAHHSPMAGSPLAPINISSSPSRPSPVQPDYSSSLIFQQQQQNHHRPPSHHATPPQRLGSSSGSNPAQRATLLGLAGRRPYDS